MPKKKRTKRADRTRSQIARGSKAKGSGFERLICKRLSLWMSRGFQDDLFWRSAMSGGRATVQFNKGAKNRTQAGDICAIHPNGERLTRLFMVDTKNYRDLRILSMLNADSGSDTLAGMWYKVRADAYTASRHPLMIAKQNFMEPFVLLDEEGADILLPAPGMPGCEPGHDHRPLHNMTWFGAHRTWMLALSVFLSHARRP